MGKGSKSPHFYPCHHLAQRAGQVHGGGGSRSPHFLGRFMGEGSRSPHFTLVTTYNRGLGQIMGEGSRSPHFYPCHHLAQRARPVRGGTEFTLSPYRTEGVVSLRKKGVGHHIFKLVTL